MTIEVIKWFIKMYTGDILSKIMIIYCFAMVNAYDNEREK